MSSQINDRMNQVIRKKFNVGRMTLDTTPEQSEDSKTVNNFIRTEARRNSQTVGVEEFLNASSQKKGDK